MLAKFSKASRYGLDIVKGFFIRLREKGPNSARIFIVVRALNLATSQLNALTSSRRVECPCCGWTGFGFLADDTVKFWLPQVFCPECGSHERQRMLQLYIDRHASRLGATQGALLSFAAEDDLRQPTCATEKIK